MKFESPKFELTRVYSDGTQDSPEIVPVTHVPWDTKMDRRGALGVGITASTVLLLLGACARQQTTKEFKIAKSDGLQKQVPRAELKAHKGPVSYLQFSTDSSKLVSYAYDNTIKVWSLPEVKLNGTIAEPLLKPQMFGITPDAAVLVANLGQGVEFRSLPTGQKVGQVADFGSTYRNNFSLSPNGMVVALAEGKDIRLYSVPKGNLLRKLIGHNNTVSFLAFSSDGSTLVSQAADENVRLWSVPDGAAKVILEDSVISDGTDTQINQSFGNGCVALLNAGRVQVWSTTDGRKIVGKSWDGKIDSIAINSNGGTLIATATISKNPSTSPVPGKSLNPSPSVGDKTTLVLWSLPDMNSLSLGNLVTTLVSGSYGSPRVGAITNDSKLVVIFEKSSDIWLISLSDLKVQSVLSGSETVRSVAVSRDGKYLAAGDHRGSIMLWDLERNEFVSYLFDETVNTNTVKGLAYNVKDKITGRTITYTLPCGSPIPAGAVCTCNCVPGTYVDPNASPTPTPVPSPRQTPRTRRRTGGSYTYCSCNKICTCIPVPSDRDVKESFEATDPLAILERLTRLSIKSWRYNWDDEKVRHIGPMAQDFAKAFEVGEDDKHIHPVDAQGVAFAAIQGLYELLVEKENDVKNLKRQLAGYESESNTLKSRVEALERLLKQSY